MLRPRFSGDLLLRILLVEDDRMIGEGLSEAFSSAGMAVDWVADGQLGREAMARARYDAVVLDLGLPRLDGASLLRHIRASGDRTPVLILTARDALDDRIAGLDNGADDYLVKPFEVREVLARLRAIVRRRGGYATSSIGTASISLDLATRTLHYRAEAHPLTAREFGLLHALLEHPGTVLSRAQLESRIYGWDDEVSSNTIEVIIHGLRRRFGNDIIRNVRGLGWRIAAD
jgi:two-component system OmpR family response regulator/two-component system response regulator QseB